ETWKSPRTKPVPACVYDFRPGNLLAICTRLERNHPLCRPHRASISTLSNVTEDACFFVQRVSCFQAVASLPKLCSGRVSCRSAIAKWRVKIQNFLYQELLVA